jgi:hypothetical protein
MYAQPAGVIHVPPAIVSQAEVVTKQEVKRHRQGQEEEEEGEVGLQELRSKVPVDGDAKEGQVQHKLHKEVLLLHQHEPNDHVLCGGALHLTPEVCSRRAPTLDADTCTAPPGSTGTSGYDQCNVIVL